VVSTPFCGRDAELSWLWAVWYRPADGAEAVVISGPVGIGKTRLAAQFARQVHAAGAAVAFVPGGAGDNIGTQLAAVVAGHPRSVPLLIVLDDGPGDLGDLRALAAARVAPTLVVATLADPLTWAAGPALRLRGLDLDATAALLEQTTGTVLPVDAIEPVWQETGGSPALLLERGRELARTVEAELARRTSAARGDLAELRDELATVVAHAADERVPAPNLRSGEPPYKGLLRYEPEDAAWFFGREQLVAEAVARLLSGRFLAVVGASGSGKSSLVRAGLVPVLRSNPTGFAPWQVSITVPGVHPAAAVLQALGAPDAFGAGATGTPERMAERALAVLPPDRRTVLVVDQFEEVFSVCRDDRERVATVALIDALCTTDRVDAAVVIVLRADFYGRCAALPRLADRVRDDQVLVGPMGAAEVRRAVEAPARRAGTTLEPGLAERVVDDVGRRVGALPLLSTALLETWRTRVADVMTVQGYEDNGGVSGAVARLAEGVFDSFDPAQQQMARDIFLRLAAGGDLRRRVGRAELGGDGDFAASVLTTLVRRRLVTAHEGTFEIAHEALFREWPRLGGWLAEDAAGQRVLTQLADAAAEWEGSGRDPSEYFRGTKLLAATEWAATNGPRLNPVEREFLAASQSAEQDAARVMRRSNRRLRSLAIGLAVVLIAAVAAAALAIESSRHANAEARVATAQRLAAAATGPGFPDLRLLLAAQARALEDSPQTRGALLSTLNDVSSVRRFLRSPAPITVTASTPDGSTVVTGDESGNVERWDAVSGAALGPPVLAQDGPVTALAVSPQGSELASGGQDGRVRLAPLDDLAKPTATIAAHTGRVEALSFVTSGGMVESAGADGLVRTFAVPSGAPQRSQSVPQGDLITLSPHGGLLVRVVDQDVNVASIPPSTTSTVHLASAPDGLAISDDDHVLAIGQGDGRIVLHAIGTAVTDQELAPPPSLAGQTPTALAFSHDRQTMAVAYGASLVRFRTSDGTPLGDPVDLRSTGITSLDFGASSASLLATDSSGETIVLDLATSVLARDLGPIGATARAVAFSSDGRLVASAAADATISVFDAASGQRLLRLRTAGTSANAVAFSPDGSLLTAGDEGTRLASSSSGSVTVWRTRDGHVVAREPVPGVAPVTATQFIDADHVAVFVSNGGTWTMDLTGRFDALRLGTLSAPVVGMAVSADRQAIVTTTQDGAVERFSTDGVALGRPVLVHAATSSLAVDRSGSVISVATDGAPEVVSGTSGAPAAFAVNDPLGTARQVALSPDGQMLAMASGGAVVLWDVPDRTRIGTPLALADASALAFSPDGRQLAIGTANGRLVLWQTDPTGWASLACQVAGRHLSRAEWGAYLPGRPYDPAC
jgi:WD40 repeat protein